MHGGVYAKADELMALSAVRACRSFPGVVSSSSAPWLVFLVPLFFPPGPTATNTNRQYSVLLLKLLLLTTITIIPLLLLLLLVYFLSNVESLQSISPHELVSKACRMQRSGVITTVVATL